MRYFFPIVIAVFLLTSCTEVKKDYYEDGNLRSELQYKGDQLHGPSIWYYRNGSKEREFHYEDGELHGRAGSWYYNGQKESVSTYIHGKRTGESRYWDEQGNLLRIEHYENDTLHGPYIEFHLNGEKKLEGEYLDGFYHGEWIYRSSTGLIVGRASYNEGSGVMKSYHPDGSLARIIPYDSNLKHGLEIHLTPGGDTIERFRFEHGDLVIRQQN